MGPLSRGVMQFTIETNAPNPTLIPSKEDLLGVTAILISVYYQKKEFFRVKSIYFFAYTHTIIFLLYNIYFPLFFIFYLYRLDTMYIITIMIQS